MEDSREGATASETSSWRHSVRDGTELFTHGCRRWSSGFSSDADRHDVGGSGCSRDVSRVAGEDDDVTSGSRRLNDGTDVRVGDADARTVDACWISTRW